MKSKHAGIAVLISLFAAIAGCDSPNADESSQSAGNDRPRDREPARGMNVASMPPVAHSPEVTRMAGSLLDGSTSLGDWWDLEIPDGEREDVLRAMLALDADSTIMLVEATRLDLRGVNLRELLIKAWAHSNPVDCYRWIMASGDPNPGQRSLLLQRLAGSLLWQFSMHNVAPEPWIELLGEMRRDGVTGQALVNIEVTLVELLPRRMPPGDALAMIERAGPLQTDRLHLLFTAAAEADIRRTFEFLESRPADQAAWLESGGDVTAVRIMAKNSPVEAFDWAINREDTASAQRSLRAAVTAWLPTSSTDASARVADLPRGDLKDAAIGAMIEWLHRMGSTQEIKPWLEELSSDESRRNYQELIEP